MPPSFPHLLIPQTLTTMTNPALPRALAATLLAAAIAFPAVLPAQPAAPAALPAPDELKTALTLTDAQVKLITPILDAQAKAFAEVTGAQTKAEAARNDANTKIAALLNDAQKTQFAALGAARGGGRGGRGRGPVDLGPLPDVHAAVPNTLPGLLGMFPGLRADQLPHGEGWAAELLTVSTHNGTHVDAPWHYASTMNHGARAWTIVEVPLDWFYRPGFRLDCRDAPDGHVVGAAELEARIAASGHELKPFDILLVNTRAGGAYGTSGYVDAGCGFGREATLWLIERGVRVMGTDGWSWDAPFSHTRRRFLETGDASIVWEGHKAGIEAAYCQIEKLANLDQLPVDGFLVACFPFKIKGASAGFTRAVAIL